MRYRIVDIYPGPMDEEDHDFDDFDDFMEEELSEVFSQIQAPVDMIPRVLEKIASRPE